MRNRAEISEGAVFLILHLYGLSAFSFTRTVELLRTKYCITVCGCFA